MSVRQALFVVILLEAAAAVLGIMSYGVTLEGLQAVTRFSGRLSLFLFTFIFLFHQHSSGNLKTWMSSRYFLIFAIAHGIHLAELLAFISLSGNELIPVRLAGGFIAYSMIFTMPVLEQRVTDGRVSLNAFSTASLIYIYYVWFIFFMTYLPRVRGTLTDAGGSYKEYVVLLGWVSLILGFKVSQLLSSRMVKIRRRGNREN
jgi:hypothetical protein